MRMLRTLMAEIEDTLAVLVLVAIFAVVVISVFFRYVLNDSLIWAEEFARFGLVVITFAGTGMGFRRASHIRVDIADRLSLGVARVAAVVTLGISLGVVGYLAVQAFRIMPILANSRSAALEMPMGWLYAMVTAGLAGGVVRILVELARSIRGQAAR
jgi:TRAP-type C4-dicarboxylate transport system permease small subunit